MFCLPFRSGHRLYFQSLLVAGSAAAIGFLFLFSVSTTKAQSPSEPVATPDGWETDPPALSSLVEFERDVSEMRIAVNRYLEDRAAIQRRYAVDYSPVRRERLRSFYRGWQQRLNDLDFDALNHEGQIDYILLSNRLEFERRMLDLEEERWQQIQPLVPFADDLRALQEDRHDRKEINPREVANILHETAQQIDRLTAELTEQEDPSGGQISEEEITPIVAYRAANYLEHLQDDVLADWNQY